MDKFKAAEIASSRNDFFNTLYVEPVAEIYDIITLIGCQPPMWYGDSWPCKLPAIQLSKYDRFEYYTPEYRRFTVRLNFEMAVYSFQDGDLFFSPGNIHPKGPARFLSVNSRLLLASGQEDNYKNVQIFKNTQDVAKHMSNTTGTTLFLARTGHSIYEERPAFFAERIVEFLMGSQ
jgi:pimeloyl-ACP methyl ester carboxylesterase